MTDGSTQYYVVGSLVFLGLAVVLLVADLLAERRGSRVVDVECQAAGLSREDLAVLRNGTMGLALLATLELHRRGAVAVSRRGQLAVTVDSVEAASPYERAAFATLHRSGQGDLHDIRASVRGLVETSRLLDDLVARGLGRAAGARRQRGSDGQESYVDALGTFLWLALVAATPFVFLSALAGDNPLRPLDDPGEQLALGVGFPLAGVFVWLGRFRTAAGRAVLRRADAEGENEEELRSVAVRGVRAVADPGLRRALKRSLAPRYTAGGG